MEITQSRKTNVIRNTKYGILKYVIQIILQFLSRTIFIRVLGSEYLGLTSVFTSILNMLNFVELGMGSAIVFSMYKPISENDIETIKSLDTLYRKIYTIIATIVLCLGLILIPFLKYFITGTTALLNVNFTLIYLIYLANAIINYLSAHKRALLFAYQRNDIENKIKTITISLLYILQIITLLLFNNFLVYVILMPLTTLLDSFFIYLSSKKMFPKISGKSNKLNSQIEKEIKKNVLAMSMHQISGTVVTSTDSLIISILISTTLAGIYSNYYTITYTITCIFTLFTNALKGSVGNMIATSSVNNSNLLFKNLNMLFSIMTGFCTIALICLIQPFIAIWTGSIDFQLNFSIVLILCLQFYLTIMRFVPNMFKDCAGLMWNDRWKPVIEAITNLVVSIILAKTLGLIGVFIGTVVSTLIAPFWIEPYVLYKYYFKMNVWDYWKTYIFNTLATIIIGLITFFLCSLLPNYGIGIFIVKIGICCVVPISLYMLFYFKTPEYKYFINLIKSYLHKNKNKEQS